MKRLIRKTVRLNAEEEYKLKEMSELSGLSESEILRLFFNNIKIIREKPSRELMNLLLKLNNIGNNINQIAKHTNTFDEIDYKTLMVCVTNLNNMVSEIRKSFL